MVNKSDSEKKLHKENEELKALIMRQEQQIDALSKKLTWYEEQHNLALQKRFGKSSEKVSENQKSLFDEAELEANPEAEEVTVEEITYKRRKAKNKKGINYEDLPVETITYDLPEEDQACPQCESSLHQMTTETRKEIAVIPAQVKVVEHVSKVYSCRNCEKNDITTPIIKAPSPKPVISGSPVSPSLMSFIMSKKYNEAMPLYRQEQQFKNYGISISRQNMANWMIRGAQDWLNPLWNRLHEILLEKDILHADESTLQVLHEEGRTAANKSFMWLYATGHKDQPIYLYDYRTTRASKHPRNMLDGFKGYLHVDGYAGYNGIPNVKLLGCWAHAKRGFTDALKAMPDKKTTTRTAAQEGLDYCNQLFKIEKELADETIENRYKKRLEQSKPVLGAFQSWLIKTKNATLPKSALGQAIKYCLNQWDKLVTFLEDGRLEISNNRAERAIKPFVLCRKNFLFCNTARGAKSSAQIYSLVETAKANNLSPFHYLTYIFSKLPNIDLDDQEQIDDLLPWSETIPETCKVQSKEE